MTRCDGCGRAYAPMRLIGTQCACPNCGRSSYFEVEALFPAPENESPEIGAESQHIFDLEDPEDESSGRKLRRRISTTCTCGRIISMPMTAIDMRVACLDCGEKIPLNREMIQADQGTGRREPRSLKWMGELGLTPFPGLPDERIGDLMVDAGLIDRKQLREALSVQGGQGGKLAEILIQLRHIDRASFVDFLARQQGVRSIEIKNYRVDNDIVGLIPYAFALEREICPIEKLGPILTVGMVCPLDSKTIRDTEEITGLTVMPYLCSAEDITRAVLRQHPDREIPVFDVAKLSRRDIA